MSTRLRQNLSEWPISWQKLTFKKLTFKSFHLSLDLKQFLKQFFNNLIQLEMQILITLFGLAGGFFLLHEVFWWWAQLWLRVSFYVPELK